MKTNVHRFERILRIIPEIATVAGLCLPVFNASQARAGTLSFADVWSKISQNSPAQEGARLLSQAADEGKSRVEKHWFPRVYLEARSYNTNDPAAAFMGVLEQRSIASGDFIPDSLNHPDSQTLTRGALGLDLALYEGGMKQAQVKMMDYAAQAEKLGGSQIEIDQYSQSGLAYGSILSLQRQEAKLLQLNKEISRLMTAYQLGQKSNPVGYSGLLGMKSLANRVAGLIEQLQAQEKAAFIALREMGVEENNWTPQGQEPSEFINHYFPSSSLEKNSYKSLAQIQGVKAAEQAAKMERAKYLPRIGAFAESYLFNGNRDTANGYTAGFYLQWNLFDPSSYGSYSEAKLKAMAADKINQASRQQESAERAALFEERQALHANLVRLVDSDNLLNEQVKVSTTLFRNGSISALQFVEILNRRADLIGQETEVELNLLKTTVALASKSNFEIPIGLRIGEK